MSDNTISKKKISKDKVISYGLSVAIVIIFICVITSSIRSCTKSGVKSYDIERIVNNGSGEYTVLVEGGQKYTFTADDVKIGEENVVCIDVDGLDELKYVSITSKMAKSLGMNIKEQDGVVIINDLPETSEETQEDERKEKPVRNLEVY